MCACSIYSSFLIDSCHKTGGRGRGQGETLLPAVPSMSPEGRLESVGPSATWDFGPFCHTVPPSGLRGSSGSWLTAPCTAH